KYGAKFLVRGGTFEAVEGKARGRNIVLEFKDHATALACYRSPEYTKAKALRAGAVDIDIIVIEGYDGPQPTGLAGLGFSKKLACHLAAISLDVAFYNLCRTHEALRMTPAMALGITHREWSIGDLIEAALAAVPTKPTSTRAQRRCHRGRRRRFRERGFMSLMLFFDEIADRRSMDPVELRLALLKDTPRGQAVVRAVMEMSDYRRSRSGRSLGLAFADYSNTLLAGVAEVSVDRSSGAIRTIPWPRPKAPSSTAWGWLSPSASPSRMAWCSSATSTITGSRDCGTCPRCT